MVILQIPVYDLIVFLLLCLAGASETFQASTGDNSTTTPLSSVLKDDLNLLSNGNFTYTCP